jgi:hypothetical protein
MPTFLPLEPRRRHVTKAAIARAIDRGDSLRATCPAYMRHFAPGRRIVKRLLFAALSVVLLVAQGIAAQSTRASIQGVWRIVDATVTGPGARTIAFAERPNLTIITARHYSRVEVQADKPRPILADAAKASADELRAAWGPFVSEAGTYEVAAGSLITMRPIASKNPAVMGPGVFITYSYKLEGDTLSLTQQRNQNGPFANPFTLRLTRVE